MTKTRSRPHRAVAWTWRVAIRFVAAAVLIVVTVLVIAAFRARNRPDLHTWHLQEPEGEFEARDARDGFDLEDYLALEDSLFDEVEAFLIQPADLDGRSVINRFVVDGPSDPNRFDRNFNRTYDMTPEGEVRGGVLLLHGLSDSPYSMRSIAELFREEGYYALCLRVPGHGTVPAGLLSVTWRDWMAAVHIAARHVRDAGGDGPFYIGGYSNGGALALKYTTEQMTDGNPTPDGIFLFSPSVGITKFAAASNWHKLLTFMDYFEKFKWVSIEPEFDPYKYNSFAKNAGAQGWGITRAVQRDLDRLQSDARMPEFPPVLAFQSICDGTVVMPALATRLFDRLGAGGDELVIFDVNSAANLREFMVQDHGPFLRGLEQDATRPYQLTVIRNVDTTSTDLIAETRAPGTADPHIEPLNVHWPTKVFSLSHLAIPFHVDDPLYGDGPILTEQGTLRVGAMSLRGERDVLSVAAASFIRLRHNPFHDYMMGRIRDWIDDEGAQ